LAIGVTVIAEVIGDVVEFVITKEGIFPEPFPARPIAALLFVHVNVVPLTEPDNVVNGVTVPAQ
jgi:hypothetical protein